MRVCWFIQTFCDLPALRLTLARLHDLYPDSCVLVISDGDPDPAIADACRTYGASFTAGDRLFGVEQGGRPVQRMLNAFLRTDGEILIKIDPDTDVRRRFSKLPDASEQALYGTVQVAADKTSQLASIQGGCIIVPRCAATTLAGSGLLESHSLKPPELAWAVGASNRARAASGLTSYDWTLGWACRALAIPMRDHSEVFSRFRPSIIDLLSPRRSAAVVHPRFSWNHFASPVFYVPRRWSSLISPRKFRGHRSRGPYWQSDGEAATDPRPQNRRD